MDKYKKLASNTIIFAIGTFSSKLLSVVLTFFYTRVMATGDFGGATLIQNAVNILVPIVTLAVNSACLRFALDKKSDKNKFTILPPSKGYIGNRLKNRIL